MTSFLDPGERLERAEEALIRIGAETFDPWARAEVERVLRDAFGVPFMCVPDESAGLAEEPVPALAVWPAGNADPRPQK